MIVNKRNRLMQALLAGLLVSISFQVQALIGGNLTCDVSGSSMDGYDFSPGDQMNVRFNGICTANRAFTKSFYPTVDITPVYGDDPGQLTVWDPLTNMKVIELPLGLYSDTCLGGVCGPIAIGRKIPYSYFVRGKAPSTPGRYAAKIVLGVTAIGAPLYAEWIHTVLYIYNVKAAGCTLTSPDVVSLKLGTINSNDLYNATQSTTVVLNCASALRANVTLTPSRAIIGPNYGTSQTSLAGLNMRAFWSDTGNPVELGSSRVMELRAGSNSVGLSFRPVLEAGKSPSGTFQSQYTLTISYL
ncbi:MULTISPECIES: hypothetical protein [Pseudomonas]|uniref:Fimbrial protein n=1 Tax=Pseudomonas juntendi TaxID=2666183 RepID=A0A7W2KF38_9PSED|nr:MULTISPECIES: hypothetical protein [Pseudomonas]MBA6097338.1 fimbrial protein [Pseudomonas juntendi]